MRYQSHVNILLHIYIFHFSKFYMRVHFYLINIYNHMCVCGSYNESEKGMVYGDNKCIPLVPAKKMIWVFCVVCMWRTIGDHPHR